MGVKLSTKIIKNIDNSKNVGLTKILAGLGILLVGKVVAQTTGSSVMSNEFTGATLKWGVVCETQSDAWTTGSAMTATVTITATAD